MSEENTNAAPEADKIEPSNGALPQDQQPVEQSEELVDREDDGSEDDAGQDDDRGDEGEERKRGKSRSERQARKIERLQAQLEELKSGKAVGAVQDEGSIEAAVKARIGEPPKESDFDDWFAFQNATAAYAAKKGIVEMQINEASARQQQAHVERVNALADDYQDNLADVAKQIPDLIETLTKSKWVPHEGVELLILETGDKAPLVSYYLAQNTDVAERLNAMSERQALREMGRIEALVSRPKSNATRAAAPLSRPKGGASSTRSIGKSMSDYASWRNQ